jgi:hypothetical protein
MPHGRLGEADFDAEAALGASGGGNEGFAGLGVLAAWAAAALLVGGLVLRLRDA